MACIQNSKAAGLVGIGLELSPVSDGGPVSFWDL